MVHAASSQTWVRRSGASCAAAAAATACNAVTSGAASSCTAPSAAEADGARAAAQPVLERAVQSVYAEQQAAEARALPALALLTSWRPTIGVGFQGGSRASGGADERRMHDVNAR